MKTMTEEAKMNNEDLYLNDNSQRSSQFNLLLCTDSDDIYVNREKCPNCNLLQSTFICKDCIVIGNFTKSSKGSAETFQQLHDRWEILKKERSRVENMCREILQTRADNVQRPKNISECRERVQALKYLIQEKKDTLQKTTKSLEESRKRNNRWREKLPVYKERVDKLSNYVNVKMRGEIMERRAKLEKCQQRLRKVVQKNIDYLVRYIFPIIKLGPTSKSSHHEDESDVVSALAEASKTSFVRGTWVLMDSSGGIQYQIVAPTLPNSGDYSAFLAVDNESGVPITESTGSNEAYNIGAALCYTTQLVNLLAFYLDILLPKRVNYADFCLRDLTDRQFDRLVSRLNANVLYLCFSQGMDSILLDPKHTLSNVLHLVRDCELGRRGPFQVDSGLMLSLECDSADTRGERDSEEEEADQYVTEWEAIPLVACPESLPGSAMSSTQAQTTSMAGGLVTSLASMFRGWAGNSK